MVSPQTMLTVTQERDFYQSELEKKGPLNPPNHMEKYALIKELNHTKVKVNATQQELWVLLAHSPLFKSILMGKGELLGTLLIHSEFRF